MLSYKRVRLEPVAFELDRAPWTRGEAFGFLCWVGYLDPIAEPALRGLAAEHTAIVRALDVPKTELQAAVNGWRTQHQLAAADLTRTWLEQHGVGLAELANHLRRKLILALLEARGENLAPTQIAPQRHLEAILGHGLFEHQWSRWVVDAALRLSTRVLGDPGPLLARSPDFISAFALRNPEHVAAAAAGFLDWRGEHLHEAALTNELERAERELERVEYAAARFAEEGQANEAVILARQERRWLEPLAEELGFLATRQSTFVEDLEHTPLGLQLGVGRPGDVFGPVEGRGGYRVVEVIGRVAPNPRDPGVRARLEARLIERHLRAEMTRWVRLR